MQMNATPVTTAASVRRVWIRPDFQVVSMDEVPMMLGSCSFQSKDVSGAQNSVFLFCGAEAARTERGSVSGGRQLTVMSSLTKNVQNSYR